MRAARRGTKSCTVHRPAVPEQPTPDLEPKRAHAQSALRRSSWAGSRRRASPSTPSVTLGQRLPEFSRGSPPCAASRPAFSSTSAGGRPLVAAPHPPPFDAHTVQLATQSDRCQFLKHGATSKLEVLSYRNTCVPARAGRGPAPEGQREHALPGHEERARAQHAARRARHQARHCAAHRQRARQPCPGRSLAPWAVSAAGVCRRPPWLKRMLYSRACGCAATACLLLLHLGRTQGLSRSLVGLPALSSCCAVTLLCLLLH